MKTGSVDISLNLRNMTSMGGANVNANSDFAGDVNVSGEAPPPPINKQSVFYRRRHQKNQSVLVGGNANGALLNNYTQLPNDYAQAPSFHQRTGSANGFSEVQTNLNMTQKAIGGF